MVCRATAAGQSGSLLASSVAVSGWSSYRRMRRNSTPVEYLWSYWKQHELPNFCPATFGQLSHHARRALRRMRQRPALVCAFWEQAELFPL